MQTENSNTEKIIYLLIYNDTSLIDNPQKYKFINRVRFIACLLIIKSMKSYITFFLKNVLLLLLYKRQKHSFQQTIKYC